MSDDLFRRTRAMFDLPKGVVYLDGNSLGAMPTSARERVRRELDESWGRRTDPRVELRRLDRFACPRRRPHRRPHRRPRGFGDRGRFDLD